MISNWLSSLQDFGALLREIYLAPGDVVLSAFIGVAPVTAANWGVVTSDEAITLAAVTSGIFWLLIAIIAWRLYRYGESFVRNFVAICRTLWYRGSQGVGSLKTRLLCRVREFVPRREESGIDAVP